MFRMSSGLVAAMLNLSRSPFSPRTFSSVFATAGWIVQAALARGGKFGLLSDRHDDRGPRGALVRLGGIAELKVLADDLVDRPFVDELAMANAGHLDVEQVARAIFLKDATGKGARAIHLRVDRHESYVAWEAADLQAPDERGHRSHLPNALGDEPDRCT